MKDPRMCLTYRYWARCLPPHRIIVVFREAAQVWPRFKWRGRRGRFINVGRARRFIRMWNEYNHAVLDALDTIAPTMVAHLVLDYHELMTNDAEFERLREFTGRDLVDVRKPELYRSRGSGDIYLQTAELLCRLTGNERPGDILDEWRRRRVVNMEDLPPSP